MRVKIISIEILKAKLGNSLKRKDKKTKGKLEKKGKEELEE